MPSIFYSIDRIADELSAALDDSFDMGGCEGEDFMVGKNAPLPAFFLVQYRLARSFI
jgi:hypothetical protein